MEIRTFKTNIFFREIACRRRQKESENLSFGKNAKSLETLIKSVFPGSSSLAGVEGLEPSKTVLETAMLPLHHTPV